MAFRFSSGFLHRGFISWMWVNRSGGFVPSDFFLSRCPCFLRSRSDPQAAPRPSHQLRRILDATHARREQEYGLPQPARLAIHCLHPTAGVIHQALAEGWVECGGVEDNALAAADGLDGPLAVRHPLGLQHQDAGRHGQGGAAVAGATGFGASRQGWQGRGHGRGVAGQLASIRPCPAAGVKGAQSLVSRCDSF